MQYRANNTGRRGHGFIAPYVPVDPFEVVDVARLVESVLAAVGDGVGNTARLADSAGVATGDVVAAAGRSGESVAASASPLSAIAADTLRAGELVVAGTGDSLLNLIRGGDSAVLAAGDALVLAARGSESAVTALGDDVGSFSRGGDFVIALMDGAVLVTNVATGRDSSVSGVGAAALQQRIMVINGDTGAVSTYALPVTVNSLAEWRSVLYLATPTGLYAMDAATDPAGPVEWRLRTGLTHFGSDKLKRVQDVNVLGQTERDLLLTVQTSRYGRAQTATYRLLPLTRRTMRDGVIKVGQGLSSVFWSFGLQGQGPTELREMRATPVELSRRR